MSSNPETHPSKLTFREALDIPSEETLRSPKHGWDNECDVREAVKLCHDWQGALVHSDAGKRRAFDLGWQLYHHGISEKTALRLILTHNRPKLPRSDIAAQLRSTYRAPVNVPGLKSLAGPPERDEEEAIVAADDDSWMEGEPFAQWPCLIEYDLKQNLSVLLAQFLQHRPGKLISAADGTIYSLGTDGLWKEITEQEIVAEVRKTDPALNFDSPKIARIVRCIHGDAYVPAKPFEWIDEPADAPAPTDLALFRNGVLNTATGVLLPHDGRLLATGTPSFDFTPDAECPTWMAFIEQTLDESFHPTVQEMLGYLMVPDTSLHVIFVLNGVKRGGKSTMMKIAENLVGRDHTASRGLNDLASDFGLEGTTDAKLLTIPDATDAEVSRRSAAVERLKTISGNDLVSVNRKNKKLVEYRIPARIMIACNRIPKMLDDSGGLASRLIPIIFEHSFLGKEDRDLFYKLEDELPGIADWALEGLRRLRANGGKFTIGKKGEAAQRSIAESQSPALRFVMARLQVTENRDDFVPLDKIYEEYEAWAVEENLSIREHRNRNDLKDDLIAVLGGRRVHYTRRRWHNPFEPPKRVAQRYSGFAGLAIKSVYVSQE
jgi:P4 family phage/plasmid primase-like protien